ncbi:MAG: MBL fold metallo-hydrolase [Desulfobacteraceae bacterium]|nr:MAG: MBL fold metallo-hydrolase [Desulfobacteraceae bacterium]
MKIKWNGHASFTITAADGTVIITDPYDPAAYGGVLKYDPVSDKADAVLVSHEHGDHNYVEGLPGSPAVLRGSGQIGNIQVTGVDAFHDETGGTQRGRNVIFAFTVDGIRICFVGDLGHQLSAEQVKSIGTVDLLLTPVGGTFTVDAQGALQLAGAIKPRVVIPMHFKTRKCNLPIAGPEDFLARMGSVKRLGKSEIEVLQATLPSGDTEAWLLEHAC